MTKIAVHIWVKKRKECETYSFSIGNNNPCKWMW